jgi:hypothetical protein
MQLLRDGFVQLLSWTPVESGTFRVNKVRNDAEIAVEWGTSEESNLPETFVDYDPNPCEYTLKSILTIVDIHTRVSSMLSVTVVDRAILTRETMHDNNSSMSSLRQASGALTLAIPAADNLRCPSLA